MTQRYPKVNGYNACPIIRTLSWIGITQNDVRDILTANGTGVQENTLRAVWLGGKAPERKRTGKFAMPSKELMILWINTTWSEGRRRINYTAMIEAANMDELRALIPSASMIETSIDSNPEVSEEPKKIEIISTDEHKCYRDVLTFVENRINVWLAGPAGSGKTTCADKVAQRLDLPFYSISVGPATTQFDLLGFYDARGELVRTQVRDAYENGGVLLIDEIDAGSAECLTAMNAILANGKAAFPDGIVNKHADCIIIAAANTFGTGPDRQYVGRSQLDAATLDRFAFLEFGYDETFERHLVVTEFGAASGSWVTYVQKLRSAVEREAIRVIISPRASIMGAKLLKAGMDRDKVETTVIWKGINEDDKARIIAASRVG